MHYDLSAHDLLHFSLLTMAETIFMKISKCRDSWSGENYVNKLEDLSRTLYDLTKIGTRSVHVGSLSEVSQGTPIEL